MDFKLISSFLGLLLLLIYIVGSSLWVSSSPNWYYQLNRPSWQPPSFFIGLIWPYNFALLAYSILKVSHTLSKNQTILWLSFFALSVSMALTWAYQFYVSHNLFLSALALLGSALLTLPLLYLNFQISQKLGLLFLPYQIWIILASSISWGYLLKN